MPFDLFSSRSNPRPKPELYIYDSLPMQFRVQVCYILDQAIGKQCTVPSEWSSPSPSYRIWKAIRDILREEFGVFHLVNDRKYSSPKDECVALLVNDSTASRALDLIEIAFRMIDRVIRADQSYPLGQRDVAVDVDSAIDALNMRFDQHHLGYQFIGGELVRRDSEFVHTELVEPAIELLLAKGFEGPNNEFMSAHKAYLKGNYRESIREALASLESTLKTIFMQRRWRFDKEKDTATKLIAIAFENQLIPDYLQSEFSSLRSMLEAGVPTLRNRTAGHGQGPEPRDVPQHLAAYAIHMSAAAIVFLVNAHQKQL